MENLLLELIQVSLDTRKELSRVPNVAEWNNLFEAAQRHSVAGIIIIGLEKLNKQNRPPQTILLQWIGNILQGYEHRYGLYLRAIGELAEWYNSHGFKMMVLKGYACSLDWPKPEYRPCGDIDIWLFGKQEPADKLLYKECGIIINTSQHHHTVFNWLNFSVENHFDFINVHHHKSNVELEKIFKELGADDSHYVEINGEKVFLPSANLHSLFLIKHMLVNFASDVLTLRQLLDWAFFVKAHKNEVDWLWLQKVLEQYGMLPLYNLLNAICIEDLGFDEKLFPKTVVDVTLKERVLNEILKPEFPGVQSSGLIARSFFKFRRWRANSWKHKLCYKESMWSAFWSGVWSHLLKPSSI